MSDATLLKRNERREREHASARASILSAARTLAAREGAEALTLRGVAQEAGYAPAALYGYFRNRADLILALAADDLSRLARAVREAGRTSDGTARFAAAAEIALTELSDAETIAAAVAALDTGAPGSEAERAFNGRLIGALRALSEASGTTSENRTGQCDVLVFAAALAGLALLSRAGRLDALGFSRAELLERLGRLFAAPPA